MTVHSRRHSSRNPLRQTRRRLARERFSLEFLEDRRLMAADMVLTWNEHLQDAIQRDADYSNPGYGSRNPAIVQLAVFDAVNAITKTHSSFLSEASAPGWASKEAAVAVAAHDTMVALYPKQAAIFNGLLADSLLQTPDGAAEDAGIAVGRRVAAEMLALRTGDGATRTGEYIPGDEPGEWTPDPTLDQKQIAWGPYWGELKTMGIAHADHFLAPPPPDVTSQEYADAYNELIRLGGIDSAERTAEQTEIGVFWAYDRQGMGPPMVLYNKNVAEIAVAKGNTLEENARLFALVNLAMADTGVVVWNTKFEYNYWRPVTAIRAGDSDGNPQTEGIEDWVPLGAPGGGVVQDFTPPFPAYTSGHAGFGAAVFETLANFYGGDNYNYSLTSDELPGVVRHFSSFSQAAEENGRSRIYLGIHWEFDNQEGQNQGRRVADYLFDRFLVELEPGRAALGVQRDGGGFRTTILNAGGSELSIYRDGSRLIVANDATGRILASDDLSKVHSLRLLANNDAADFVTIDNLRGGAFHLPGGLLYDSGRYEGDGLWYNGTRNRDVIKLRRDALDTPTGMIRLLNVSYVGLAAHGAHDYFVVSGDQKGRVIDLLGDSGSDTYVLSPTNARINVIDPRGYDTLDFSIAGQGVTVDLAKRYGQTQPVGDGGILAIDGVIENLTGSQFDDVLLGNQFANRLFGLAGDDILIGRAGHDLLDGGEGNDVLSGGDGNDELWSGAGDDLLIGGNNRDILVGEGGQDAFIGGSTVHDERVRALQALLAEWTARRPLEERIANLRSGANANRKNGDYFLNDRGSSPTVFADQAHDRYFGDEATEWFIRDSAD